MSTFHHNVLQLWVEINDIAVSLKLYNYINKLLLQLQ